MDTNQHEEGGRALAGDLLVGAERHPPASFLSRNVEELNPYYLKRAGNWPIGKTGGNAVLSPRNASYARHAQKLTNPQKSDAA